MQINRPGRIARSRHGYKENDERMGNTACRPHARIKMLEQYGLGIHEKIKGKHARKPDHERFYCPPTAFRRTSIELFGQCKPED